jgi:hypothetical protein
VLPTSGYNLMVTGLLFLLYSRDLFSDSPFVIPLQAAALLLMLRARITFIPGAFIWLLLDDGSGAGHTAFLGVS